jgi:hypothetical protein
MLAAQVPGRDSFEDFVIFQESQIEKLGIDLRTKCNATIDDIIALEPDAVICATGSLPRIPESPGVNSSHVFTIHDVLAKRVSLDQLGERVAVVSQENGFESSPRRTASRRPTSPTTSPSAERPWTCSTPGSRSAVTSTATRSDRSWDVWSTTK